MPRAARLYAPGGTAHVAARCNNREFCFTSSEDFELLVALLREMLRTYECQRPAIGSHPGSPHGEPAKDVAGSLASGLSGPLLWSCLLLR